jgi:hypothetical protein
MTLRLTTPFTRANRYAALEGRHNGCCKSGCRRAPIAHGEPATTELWSRIVESRIFLTHAAVKL